MHYYRINNGNRIIILIVLACSLTCPAGYTVNSKCTGCDFTSICNADNPCMNGGQCIQYSPPHNYNCDCTGTGYQGTNCTGKY